MPPKNNDGTNATATATAGSRSFSMFSDFFRRAGSDPTQKNYQRRRELSIGHIFSLLRPLAPENRLKNRKVKIQKKSRSCHIPAKPPAPKISEMCSLKPFSCCCCCWLAALAEKTKTGFAGKQLSVQTKIVYKTIAVSKTYKS